MKTMNKIGNRGNVNMKIMNKIGYRRNLNMKIMNKIGNWSIMSCITLRKENVGCICCLYTDLVQQCSS